MDEFLTRVYWGNRVLDYALVTGSVLIAWIVLRIVKRKILSRLKKIVQRTVTNFDDLLIKAVEKFVIPYLYLLINYHIITQLNLADRLIGALNIALVFITTYYVVRIINFLIYGSVIFYMERKDEPPGRIKQLNGILLVVKAAVWGAGLIMLIDNLGYNVTTIIAGLGIGGIAIALAAQNILSDLFSYLVIFFDKPFEVGDFITVDNYGGSVEKIGIKTSHLRSPDGQQMIMPNSELVKSVINNYKRLQRRRILFSVGLVYSTTPEKLRKVSDLVKEIIVQQKLTTFDRVHFKSFGDFSLNFEIAYYIESMDFMDMMNTHHNVCIAIFEKFQQEEIEFAYPTQTLFLEKTMPAQKKEPVG